MYSGNLGLTADEDCKVETSCVYNDHCVIIILLTYKIATILTQFTYVPPYLAISINKHAVVALCDHVTSMYVCMYVCMYVYTYLGEPMHSLSRNFQRIK